MRILNTNTINVESPINIGYVKAIFFVWDFKSKFNATNNTVEDVKRIIGESEKKRRMNKEVNVKQRQKKSSVFVVKQNGSIYVSM